MRKLFYRLWELIINIFHTPPKIKRDNYSTEFLNKKNVKSPKFSVKCTNPTFQNLTETKVLTEYCEDQVDKSLAKDCGLLEKSCNFRSGKEITCKVSTSSCYAPNGILCEESSDKKIYSDSYGTYFSGNEIGGPSKFACKFK